MLFVDRHQKLGDLVGVLFAEKLEIVGGALQRVVGITADDLRHSNTPDLAIRHAIFVDAQDPIRPLADDLTFLVSCAHLSGPIKAI